MSLIISLMSCSRVLEEPLNDVYGVSYLPSKNSLNSSNCAFSVIVIEPELLIAPWNDISYPPTTGPMESTVDPSTSALVVIDQEGPAS